MKYGIDVSVWQNPLKLNWEKLKLTQKFVICRASYGTIKDNKIDLHFKNARRAGMLVGAYHFFRQTKSASSQIEVFEKVCKSINYGPEDIIPVLDIEGNEQFDGPVDAKKYNEGCKIMAEAFKEKYGDCIIYTTKAFWVQLGKPKWLLEYPQWVAHWGVNKPDVPGDKPWTIWQYKVAVLEGFDGKEIDQNKSIDEIPLIKSKEESLKQDHLSIENNKDQAADNNSEKQSSKDDLVKGNKTNNVTEDNTKENNTVKESKDDLKNNKLSNVENKLSNNNNIIFNLLNFIIKLFNKIINKK